MTNIFPQQRQNNSPMWAQLEKFERDLVTKKGKELYIFAGGYGTLQDPRPFDPTYPSDPKKSPNSDANKTLKTKDKNGQPLVTVASNLWKVIVVLDEGQDINDINQNTPIIAVDLPNVNPLGNKWYENWSSTFNPIISVKELESRLNQDPINKAQGIKYNFFNNSNIKEVDKLKTIAGFDSSGKPNAGTILIDHDANGIGWFIDQTPLDNSEFTTQNSASYFLADPESEANGKYDLLTTVLHELAHLYGFIDGYAGFEQLKTKNVLVGDNFTATLDGEHLDKQAYPYDLLNTHLAPGIRKLPSELDVEILKAILATEERPQPLPNPLLVGEG